MALIVLAVPLAAVAGTPTFFNVLLPDGADPWVIRHSNGHYYMTGSTGTNITLRRSRSLVGLGAGDSKIVWLPPATGPYSKELWAPEIHHVNGKWYIYFAADDGRNENHRIYALENQNHDPFQGEFVFRGKVFDPHSDKWAIDATLFNTGEKLFLIWSGWEGNENVRQNLYIAPMRDPLTISGPRVELSRPQHPWETIGKPQVNEGPEIIVRNGLVHLVYSASGSWTDDYCLGLLTAKVGSDLLAPSSWTKHDQPVFRRAPGVLAPGHASFVKSRDGKEDWIVYHSARFSGAGWTRMVRTQPFYWENNGLPRFGTPGDPSTPIPVPGGDPPHVRYEAEEAKLHGAARSIPRPEASNRAKVGFIETAESDVEFTVRVEKNGQFILAVRFGNGTINRRRATHLVTLNGKAIAELSYPTSGWDHWSNAFLRVELERGKNSIRFSKGRGVAEIDCLDVIPAED
jgi:GH43 family beta-xylosidase